MNKDLKKRNKCNNAVVAMQKLLKEREKAKDTLKAIDMTLRNLVYQSCKKEDVVNAFLDIKHCKRYGEDHKVKIKKYFEENYHNGNPEKWYMLICDKCKHDGCGCSCFDLAKNGKGIRHMLKESIVLNWLSNGELT